MPPAAGAGAGAAGAGAGAGAAATGAGAAAGAVIGAAGAISPCQPMTVSLPVSPRPDILSHTDRSRYRNCPLPA